MIGLTEMINKVISLGAEKRMTDLEFIEAELSKWLSSSERQMMIDGERYYNGDHDILDKTRTYKYNGSEVVVEGIPNNRIVDNLYRKMVIQKTNYLLGKPLTVTTDNDDYQDSINKIFNKCRT